MSLLLCSCFPPDTRFLTTLSDSGFRSIRLGERVLLVCGRDYGRNFRAINPLGVVVEGVVCCGAGPGCSVRL